MDKFTGRVWVLGDDIDTDIIIPTEYLALKTIDDMKQYGFSPLRPELAGTTRNLTFSDTFFPLITCAPTRRSSIRPLLQDPRNASSILIPRTSFAGARLSTKSGFATTGSTLDKSNVYSLT